MADEEKDEKTEAPEVEATPEAAEAPVPDEPAEETVPDEPASAPAPAADAEPVEKLHPKEKRKQERSAHAGEASPERTDEQRAVDRDAERKRKAASRSRYRTKQRKAKGEPGTGTPPVEREPGTQRIMQGIVTSSKADKTITVKIESARRHPAYEKIVRRSKNIHAHDEANDAGEGDTVRVVETRPMSKSKRWRLVEVMERAR